MITKLLSITNVGIADVSLATFSNDSDYLISSWVGISSSYDFNNRVSASGVNLVTVLREHTDGNFFTFIETESGYKWQLRFVEENTYKVLYEWRRYKNGNYENGGNNSIAKISGGATKMFLIGIDEDNNRGYMLHTGTYSNSTNYYINSAITDGECAGMTNADIYNAFVGSIPIVYGYIPVAYFRSSLSHLNLSMISGYHTNHGDPVTDVDSSYFKRINTPAPGSKINDIVAGLVVNAEKVIGWTSNTNRVTIKRMPDNGVKKVYTFKYYDNGAYVGSLDHTIEIESPEEYFYSFLLDPINNAARPSVIKANPLAANPYSYNSETVSAAQQTAYRHWIGLGYGITIPTDPGYWNNEAEPATPGTDEPGAGGGVNDKTTGNVQPPAALPGVNALNTGFITLWGPSLTEMTNLANYMWNTLDLANWRKIFADPMDCILACYMYPLTSTIVRGTPNPATAYVNVGNISTGIEMHLIEDQFITCDFGTLHIDRQTNSYMDFSPYTKASLFLPYIGIVALDVDEIMGKDINLTYNIDLMTGTCLAMLTCETTDGSDVLYQWAGNCAVPIPITSASFDTIIKNAISVVGTTAAAVCAVASGGTTVAGAALAGGAAAQTLSNVVDSKPQVGRSGALGSSASFIGVQEAYLIWEYPNEWRAGEQAAIEGYPLYSTETLSNLTGYTVVHEMHLEGMSCTQTEADEIMQLLKEGVII